MEINNILKDYLVNKNTDYAIMINGKWGSGKTYYWKQELTKVISETIYEKNIETKEAEKKLFGRSQKNEEIEKITYFEAVYVSLYGLSDISELDKKIFIELNPFWKKKGIKIATNIGKLILNKGISFFGVDKFENSEFSDIIKNLDIGKNKVICFDDLERLKPEILNEIFGFINLFTEHDNIKVVILCDESEISDKVANYNRVKEKLIRFTYNFDPELTSVYPSFVSKYDKQLYTEFLNSKNQFICGLYNKVNHKNLRTLKFNLDIFEKIFDSVQEHSETEKYRGEILNRLLLFTSSYCIEYKIEQDRSKLNEISKISSDNYLNLSNIDWDNILFTQDKQKEEKEKPKEYFELFKERYLPYQDTHFDYYTPIVEFIHTGVLDDDELYSELFKIHNSLLQNEITRESEIIQKLNNIYLLEDNELTPLLGELLENVKNGKYQVATYPNIFLSLLRIEHFGINQFEINDALIQVFSEGIQKGKVHSKYIESFEFRIPIFDKRNEKYESVKKIAVEANLSLKEDANLLYVNDIKEAIITNQGQKLFDLLTNTQVQFEPIFTLIDPKDFFEITLKLTNEGKCYLNDALHRRYSYHFASDTSKRETLFFVDYLTLIKQHLTSNGTTLISNDILRLISDNLARIINLPD
jgi:hypothetical protein